VTGLRVSKQEFESKLSDLIFVKNWKRAKSYRDIAEECFKLGEPAIFTKLTTSPYLIDVKDIGQLLSDAGFVLVDKQALQKEHDEINSQIVGGLQEEAYSEGRRDLMCELLGEGKETREDKPCLKELYEWLDQHDKKGEGEKP